MVEALQVYRYGAERISNTGDGWNAITICDEDTNAPESNAYTDQPGQSFHMLSGFSIRGDDHPSVKNNEIVVKDTGTAVTITAYLYDSNDSSKTPAAGGFYPNCYSGDDLATHVADRIQTQFAAAGNPVVVTGAYGATSKLFTFTFDTACELLFSTNAITQTLGETLGFGTADTASNASQVSATAVNCQDSHWITWQLNNKSNPDNVRVVMAYDLNLDSGDEVRLFGHTALLGPDYLDWVDGADYVADVQTSTNSGLNELFIWRPRNDLDTGNAEFTYWHLAILRKQATSAGDFTSIGVLGAWASALYSGDRNFVTPWTMQPFNPSIATFSAQGGGSFLERRRPHYVGTIPFRRWGASTYRTFEQMYTKFDKFSGLWLLQPENIVENTAVFARLVELNQTEITGPENVASFEVDLEQIPMRARD
jgi:hypothetical protein